MTYEDVLLLKTAEVEHLRATTQLIRSVTAHEPISVTAEIYLKVNDASNDLARVWDELHIAPQYRADYITLVSMLD